MSVPGAAAGVAIDAVLGEPPVALHPVVWFGRSTSWLERRVYGPSRARGASVVAAGVGGAVLAGVALRRVAGPAAATAIATAVAVAGRMLADTATDVARALEAGDLPAARASLPALVGRDAADLDAGEIARAVVESVAENTVDAVTAPLLWAAVGGAPAVLAHRAVNTLDAMIGHRDARYREFGWAAARLDDVANWPAARLTAAAVAVTHPRRATAVARAVRRDADRHPSPNGGVVEAAFAAALAIRLGGTNSYGGVVEDRGTLGDGRPAEPADIRRAIGVARRATAALTAVLLVANAVSDRRQRVRRAARRMAP